MNATTDTGSWAPKDLDVLDAATEIKVASVGPDGSLRSDTTIWVVLVADGIYVRSYRGATGGWYRAARQSGLGRVTGGGIKRDVTFTKTDGPERDAVDAAYRHKYGQSSYTDAMVSADATATTLRVTPR
jgi:hypothetical protein